MIYRAIGAAGAARQALRGEFTVSQRALRGEQNKGGRLREPTALSLARDALPRSASSSPRPRKRQRSPTPPPVDSALEAMTGAQLRKLMARQGVGGSPQPGPPTCARY